MSENTRSTPPAPARPTKAPSPAAGRPEQAHTAQDGPARDHAGHGEDGPDVTAARLDALVHQILDGTDGADAPLAVIAVAAAEPGRWELVATTELSDLLGFEAPEEVDAIGVRATGRAWNVTDPDLATPASPPPRTPGAPAAGERVDLVVVMDRAGRVAGEVRGPDGAHFDVPTEGRIPDTLRRALGLPTAPPQADPRRLLVTLWLIEILARPVRSGAKLGWTRVLEYHPANRHGAAGRRLARLEADMAAVDAAAGWGLARTLTAAGGGMAAICPPELAAWMDDGFFSRWVVGELVDADRILDAVLADLTPSAGERLLDAIAGVGDWGAQLVERRMPAARSTRAGTPASRHAG